MKMNVLKLAARLREHAEGPAICPKCRNERNKEWKYECTSEGQCDGICIMEHIQMVE